MVTTHSAPADLYSEAEGGPAAEGQPDATNEERHPWEARPADNGDRDQPAIDAGQGRLEQVLGW